MQICIKIKKAPYCMVRGKNKGLNYENLSLVYIRKLIDAVNYI